MEQQEIKTLKLFEALDENGSQSQRELAKKLDISLGLVNALLKRIVQKGFFTVVNANKNKIRYVLTPKGITEKSVLTYRYVKHSIKYYIDIKLKINNFVNYLSSTNKKNIVIYGANEIAEIICITLRDNDMNIVGIVDDLKEGKRMFGMSICNSVSSFKDSYDAIVMTNMEDPSSIILSNDHGMCQDRIYSLHQYL